MSPKCSSLNLLKHLPYDLKITYSTIKLCQTSSMHHTLMKIHLSQFMPIIVVILLQPLKCSISERLYLFYSPMFENVECLYLFIPHKCYLFASFLLFCCYQKRDVTLDSAVNIKASMDIHESHWPPCVIFAIQNVQLLRIGMLQGLFHKTNKQMIKKKKIFVHLIKPYDI